MASPRPLSLPNRLAGTLLEDLGEALADHALPSGLIRSADALSPAVGCHDGTRLCTGVLPLDQLLAGGLAAGSFAELTGPLSSGLTAVAQALAAAASRSARAAWVDLADSFDPPSADASGVELERLLWVRAPSAQVALRASERLLLSRAFSLVVLDFFAPPEVGARARSASGGRRLRPPPSSAWRRLQRSAARAPCALLLLSSEPLARAVPMLTVHALPAEPRFDEGQTPARPPRESWLEGATAHFHLVRDRRRPREAAASLPLAAHPEVAPRARRVSSGSRSPRRSSTPRES